MSNSSGAWIGKCRNDVCPGGARCVRDFQNMWGHLRFGVHIDRNLLLKEDCSGRTGACPVPDVIADAKVDNTAVAPPGASLHPIADEPDTSRRRRGPLPNSPVPPERTRLQPNHPTKPIISLLINHGIYIRMNTMNIKGIFISRNTIIN